MVIAISPMLELPLLFALALMLLAPISATLAVMMLEKTVLMRRVIESDMSVLLGATNLLLLTLPKLILQNMFFQWLLLPIRSLAVDL